MKTRLLCGLFFAALANADVRLPALLSDHMVLQRETPVRIWGWADPGEPVTVSFDGQKTSAIADSAGKWQVFLSLFHGADPRSDSSREEYRHHSRRTDR
jgi:sialate O-acetylesterase